MGRVRLSISLFPEPFFGLSCPFCQSLVHTQSALGAANATHPGYKDSCRCLLYKLQSYRNVPLLPAANFQPSPIRTSALSLEPTHSYHFHCTYHFSTHLPSDSNLDTCLRSYPALSFQIFINSSLQPKSLMITTIGPRDARNSSNPWKLPFTALK